MTIDTPAPAEALSREQLEALKGHTPGPWHVANKVGEVVIIRTPSGLGVGSALTREEDHPDARLIAAAPDLLTTALAALARAEAAEAALKVATAGLKHIASLAARKQRDALTEFAESGHYASTTYEELMQEYETLKRPSEIAHEALAKSQPLALAGSPS